MIMQRILVLLTPIFIFGCLVLPSASAQAQAPSLAEIKAGGVSFIYRTTDFAGVEIERVKKNVVLGEGPSESESPAHYCFNLKDKRPLPALEEGPRYFFPTDSFICAVPLQDASVKDFNKAYSPLVYDAGNLRKLLRDHPGDLKQWSDSTKTDIPDFPDVDGGNSIVSKFQYLAFRSGTGVLFITQYSNESEPNPVNNEELTLDFQGLTKDGKYYVCARFAITHPGLPRGIDFTDDIKRDMNGNYLKREEKELDGFPEASFRPSMKDLKAILSSIYVAR